MVVHLFLYIDLQHLRSLLEVGSQKNFTNCPTYEELRDTIRVCVCWRRERMGEGGEERRKDGSLKGIELEEDRLQYASVHVCVLGLHTKE